MIQEIRDSVLSGSRTTQVIVILAVVSVASISIRGLVALFGRQQRHDVVGYFGSEPITRHEFAHKISEYNRLVSYFQQQFGGFAKVILNMQGMNDPETYALNQIRLGKVLRHVVDAQKLQFSTDCSAEKLCDARYMLTNLGDLVPPYVYTPDGKIDQKIFAGHLARQGLTLSDFDSIFEQTLKKDLAMQLIKSSFYNPRSRKKCIDEQAERSFTVAQISYDAYRAAVQKEPVTDAALKAFYDQENAQSKRYWSEEAREGFVWKFNVDTYDRAISESAITKYFNEHKKEYVLKPERIHYRRMVIRDGKSATEIHETLNKTPEKFAELAQKHSIDKKNASKGGDSGWLEIVPDPAKLQGDARVRYEKIFGLYKDGAISPVFKTDEGFEIVSRIQKEHATYQDLNNVRDSIVKAIKAKVFEKAFAQEAREVLRDPDKFTAFAKKHKASKEASADKRLSEIAKVGGRKIVDLGTVLELSLLTPARQTPLESIKDRVRQDYFEIQARERFDQELLGLQKQFFDNPGSLKGDFASATFSENDIKSSADWERLAQKGLPVDRMKRMVHAKKGLSDVHLDAKVTAPQSPLGATLVRLEKISVPSEKKCGVGAGGEKELTEDVFASAVVASLQRNVKLELNRDVIAQFKKHVS